MPKAARIDGDCDAIPSLNLALNKLGLSTGPNSPCGFDSFYTPKNTDFYQNYSYLPLNPQYHEIRLLKVYPQKRTKAQHLAEHPRWPKLSSPGNDENDDTPMIACEMVDKVPIARIQGRYCALSYCAGSPTRTAPILVDGMVMNVFANLGDAIECAISHWASKNSRKEFLLWADQICINQSDLAERGSQVSMMREIYHRCDEALVCLSTIAPEGVPATVHGFEWMQVPSSAPAAENHRMKYAESPEELMTFLWKNLIRSTILTRWLDSLRSFITSPWWTRSWVYQEFITAARVQILWHHESQPWNRVSAFLTLVCGDLDKLLRSWPSLISKGKYDEQLSIEQNLQDRQEQSNELYQRQLKEYNRNLPLMESDLEALKREYTKNFQAVNSTFEKELKSLRKNNVTLLSATSDKIRKYEIGRIEKVRTDQSRALGQSYSNSVKETRDYWEPNLNPPKRAGKALTLEMVHKGIQTLQTGFNEIEWAISAVESLRNGRDSSQNSRDLKELLEHSRHCHSSDARDRVYAFLGLTHIDYKIVPSYHWTNTVVHVFIETSQHIIELDGNLSILEHAAAGRRDLSCFLPTWVPDWTSPPDRSATAFQDCHNSLTGTGETKLPPFQASGSLDSPLVMYRRTDDDNETLVELGVNGIFVTCLAAREDHANQHLAPSAASSDIQTFSSTSPNLRVFTRKEARPGNQIWVICGVRWPVVLQQESEDRYSLLGEALVCDLDNKLSDVMFGKAVDTLQQGANPVEIWLI